MRKETRRLLKSILDKSKGGSDYTAMISKFSTTWEMGDGGSFCVDLRIGANRYIRVTVSISGAFVIRYKMPSDNTSFIIDCTKNEKPSKGLEIHQYNLDVALVQSVAKYASECIQNMYEHDVSYIAT